MKKIRWRMKRLNSAQHPYFHRQEFTLLSSLSQASSLFHSSQKGDKLDKHMNTGINWHQYFKSY